MSKLVNLTSFWKAEAWGQTVLPDRSILIRQKSVQSENSLIHNVKKNHNFLVKLHTIFLCCRIMHFKWHKRPEKTAIFLKDCWAYGNISWVDRDDEFARVFATILRTHSGFVPDSSAAAGRPTSYSWTFFNVIPRQIPYTKSSCE